MKSRSVSSGLCHNGDRHNSGSCLRKPHAGDHIAKLYTDSSSLLKAIELFMGAGLEQGEAGIVIAVQPHLDHVKQRLQRRGLDCESLLRCHQLVLLDAERALASILDSEGNPSRASFNELIRPVIVEAASRYPRVRAYGELVNLLWQRSAMQGAHLLEMWWNELLEEFKFTLLCGYQANVFDNDPSVQEGLAKVCSTHSHVFPVDDAERFERALNAALQTVVPEADVRQMREGLASRRRQPTSMPEAQAALLALQDILPPLARDVRTLAREFYHHGQ